jgi:hypothetical protein
MTQVVILLIRPLPAYMSFREFDFSVFPYLRQLWRDSCLRIRDFRPTRSGRLKKFQVGAYRGRSNSNDSKNVGGDEAEGGVTLRERCE